MTDKRTELYKLIALLDLDESYIAGQSALQKIVEAEVCGDSLTIHTPSGGDDMDISGVLELVAKVVSTLSSIIDIKRSLSPEEEKRRMALDILRSSRQQFSDDQIDRLMDHVFGETG